MTVRPARADERNYIRETTLKVTRPSGASFRQWEATATAWANGLGATVVSEGDNLILGFALEGPAGVQVLYVRRKFRGVGLGGELMQGRRRDPFAVGFGDWSDFRG